MDPKVFQFINEIVQLAAQLQREVIECSEYARRGDKSNTLRNLNENRDELNRLNQKWQELTSLLNR
jgi:t-SNARE complex subunit (syntaxin)